MSNNFDYNRISFNAGLLVAEMQRRNIKTTYLGETNLIRASYKSHDELLYDVHTSLVNYPFGWIINDKFYSKQWLKKHQFPVAEGGVFSINGERSAIAYAAKIGFPVVLKPTTGSHGDSVWTNIDSRQELKRKIAIFKKRYHHNGYFLIEKHASGNEYRLFITKTGFFAAVFRKPANVVGTGKNSLLVLIEKENRRRMHPRNTCLCEIRLDEITFDYMEKHHLNLDFVPKKAAIVFLRENSNISTGGNCFEVTKTVHPSIKKIAVEILNSFPNLAFIGIDLITADITQEIKKSGYVICELNSAPGLSLHMMPEKGRPQNVAGALVDLLFPETIYASY